MDIANYISIKWGDGPLRDFVADDWRVHDARFNAVWSAVALIAGTTEPPPATIEVHSPRALPTLLDPETEPTIVWDAGLGTIMSQLAFTLSYRQPESVVEALLRRLFAMRYIVSGDLERAGIEVDRASAILELTPIATPYLDDEDAEKSLETWLLTELQERFVLAHELTHFLKVVDPASFESIGGLIDSVVNGADSAASLGKSILLSIDRDFPSFSDLSGRDLDGYAWYVPRVGREFRRQPTTGRREIQGTRNAFKHNVALREEIICDTLAALAVCLDAQRRGRGWTAIMGASCSKLALVNLGVVLEIDNRVSSVHPWLATPHDVQVRAEAMDAILPTLLPAVLNDHDQSALVADDVYEVLRLADDIHAAWIRSVLGSIGRARGPRGRERRTPDRILAEAGFLYMR